MTSPVWEVWLTWVGFYMSVTNLTFIKALLWQIVRGSLKVKGVKYSPVTWDIFLRGHWVHVGSNSSEPVRTITQKSRVFKAGGRAVSRDADYRWEWMWWCKMWGVISGALGAPGEGQTREFAWQSLLEASLGFSNKGTVSLVLSSCCAQKQNVVWTELHQRNSYIHKLILQSVLSPSEC